MKVVWLASYPKSGNTWFRMVLANLAAEGDEPVDINDLPEGGGIASARETFERQLLIDSGLLTHDEVDALRPLLYEASAREEDDPPDEVSPIRFVKAHDAYLTTPGGEPLMAGSRGAAGAIVIVRDPRDVAVSLANHIGVGIDDAIAFLGDKRAAFSAKTASLSRQLRQRLLDWSGHVASWLGQTDIPVHLVRYEDLQADAPAAFRAALAFAGHSATEDQILRAVRLASFAELQRQEQAKGFREAPSRIASGFFRRGEAEAWRDELTPAQAARIAKEHAAMMSRLGYEFEVRSAPVRAV